MKRVAAGYARKRFSNVQLVIDCWWLVATCDVVATQLALPFGFGSLAIGLTAFASYRLGVSMALHSTLARDTNRGPRLLVLRVFGYQARTERLFDHLTERWRFHGPVRLIAGTDLATHHRPYLRSERRLDRQYVASVRSARTGVVSR